MEVPHLDELSDLGSHPIKSCQVAHRNGAGLALQLHPSVSVCLSPELRWGRCWDCGRARRSGAFGLLGSLSNEAYWVLAARLVPRTSPFASPAVPHEVIRAVACSNVSLSNGIAFTTCQCVSGLRLDRGDGGGRGSFDRRRNRVVGFLRSQVTCRESSRQRSRRWLGAIRLFGPSIGRGHLRRASW